ncbi:MAG TPA: flagellar basal body-associated FliL family protein [Planctomycetota bacterium]|nr:flagellar basal body-associated FliL family protein [Planctomycetota bacterium]
MSEKQSEKPGTATAEAPAKGGKWKKLGAGIAAIGVLAFVAATLATPGKQGVPSYRGPFVSPVAPGSLSTNLAGNSHKRFLVMKINAMYDAYDQAYVTGRTADPVYTALVTDAVLSVSSLRTVEEVMEGVSKEVFREELRMALDPILFPLHVGDTESPSDADPESGVRPGLSASESSFREPLFENSLLVDAVRGVVQLGDGPEQRFDGDEQDLRVQDAQGRFVHVDVTDVVPEFQGRVPVGVQGAIRKLLFDQYVVQ